MPWRALREALEGDLLPGVYGLTGPIACGKTQLALQIAAGGLEQDRPVSLWAPHLSSRELSARLEGLRTHTRWIDHHASPPPLPPRLTLADDPPGHLHVVDQAMPDLDHARRMALRFETAVLLVLAPANPESVNGFIPPHVLRGAPSELATWLGVATRTAAELDALIVLAPGRPRITAGWSTLELALAKHRRGLPARTALRFNGTWFEDEPEEIDLGIGQP